MWVGGGAGAEENHEQGLLRLDPLLGPWLQFTRNAVISGISFITSLSPRSRPRLLGRDSPDQLPPKGKREGTEGLLSPELRLEFCLGTSGLGMVQNGNIILEVKSLAPDFWDLNPDAITY